MPAGSHEEKNALPSGFSFMARGGGVKAHALTIRGLCKPFYSILNVVLISIVNSTYLGPICRDTVRKIMRNFEKKLG